MCHAFLQPNLPVKRCTQNWNGVGEALWAAHRIINSK
jgi:hypothetical protein